MAEQNPTATPPNPASTATPSTPASTAARTARRAARAVAGKGRVIAATAGVVAATAAGVAAVKALKGRSSKGGGGNGRVYHVQPKGEDWQIAVEGNERPSGTYGTKKQAISAGRALAQKHEPSQLVIHGGDGSVQRTHNYGDA